MSWVFPRKVYHPATSRKTIPPLAPRRNRAKLPPAAAASRPFRDTMPRGDGAEAETPQDALAALSARLRECGELGDAVGFRTTLEAFNDEHDETQRFVGCGLAGAEAKGELARALLASLGEALPAGDEASFLADEEVARRCVQALRCVRTLLREEEGAQPLRSRDALQLYLRGVRSACDVTRRAVDVASWTMHCLALATSVDREAMGAFCSDMDGVAALLAVLHGAASATTLYYAARLLYLICGTRTPALRQLVSAEPQELLISTLAWVVRSGEPPFPQGLHRVGLGAEALKLLFLMQHFATSDAGVGSLLSEQDPRMTQLGVLVAEALLLPNEYVEVIEMKMHVVHLMLFMPETYAFFMELHGSVPALARLLSVQLARAATDGDIDEQKLLPLLQVMLKAVRGSDACKASLRRILFPAPLPARRLAAPASEEEKKKLAEERMHPADAPEKTFRGRFVALCCSLDGNVKTVAAEILHALCDGDDEEFVNRIGMGNAVGYLRMKGVVSVAGLGQQP